MRNGSGLIVEVWFRDTLPLVAEGILLQCSEGHYGGVLVMRLFPFALLCDCGVDPYLLVVLIAAFIPRTAQVSQSVTHVDGCVGNKSGAL